MANIPNRIEDLIYNHETGQLFRKSVLDGRLLWKELNSIAKYHVEKFGTVQSDGWIHFEDGSKYNTANNQTINPGDIVI